MFHGRNAFHDGRTESDVLGEQLTVLDAALLQIDVKVRAETRDDRLDAAVPWPKKNKTKQFRSQPVHLRSRLERALKLFWAIELVSHPVALLKRVLSLVSAVRAYCFVTRWLCAESSRFCIKSTTSSSTACPSKRNSVPVQFCPFFFIGLPTEGPLGSQCSGAAR